MTLSLGRKLQIRAMVHVAGEPIPYFWPMRTFIHHNPLYGLEHLPFEQAVQEGKRLFHAGGYLSRSLYQQYLGSGKIELARLSEEVGRFVSTRPAIADIELHRLLMTLLTEVGEHVAPALELADAYDVHAMLSGRALAPREFGRASIASLVKADLPGNCPVYTGVDALFGTEIGIVLDELVIKSCLDFFDEGQSVWQMPGRESGLFAAWAALAKRNLRLFIRGLHIKQILAVDDSPEGIISHVMSELEVPEAEWMDYFTNELTRLHGWTGFIRWRAGAKHYYWARTYPADLVDYLAIRMVLGLALLREHAHRKKTPASASALMRFLEECPEETYLRSEFHRGRVLPAMAHAVEDAISSRRKTRLSRLMPEYLQRKREHEAKHRVSGLRQLAERSRQGEKLLQLSPEALHDLLMLLAQFEQEEGQFWLNAHEAQHMKGLLSGLNLAPTPAREKRPFAQMMFCIDVRSERIRRNLEKVGDYQTFGIAGFFGIPVSFIGLDKGTETHLCPVVVTPKNVVLELTLSRPAGEEDFVSILEEVFHELKASVISPFMTVEAIGLLFGLDMFGKTFAPLAYNRWRQRLHPEKRSSSLLVDKLTREQADSIIRSLQRAMIVKAIGRELKIERERVTDEMIRELRETALGHREGPTEFGGHFKLDPQVEQKFIERLRRFYRVNRGYAQIQLERLGRIGFTLDEQVHLANQALRSIGLTKGFSRFVLLTGHGSTSENNPYESALDCGACGGNHGIVNARVLAQIANKPAVRERLRAKGIEVADDAWFIPAFHNTTTDELRAYDLDLLPPSHLVYVERLFNGLKAASRLCAAERLPTLEPLYKNGRTPASASRNAWRHAMDWSQVRPEWGLSRNAAFVIGRRCITAHLDLDARAFLHSYDYKCDAKGRLLENILAGPVVVAQWINMEHYFSTVDNEHYGSGSKVYHNIAGRFGVMTGNLSDLRTGLPAQTVLRDGLPYHEPLRLLVVIESPLAHAKRAVEAVRAIKNLVYNGWVRMAIVDPETRDYYVFQHDDWQQQPARVSDSAPHTTKEHIA